MIGFFDNIQWLRNILRSLKGIGVLILPIYFLAEFLIWFATDYLFAKARATVVHFKSLLPDSVDVGLGSVSQIPWAKVDAVFPVNDFVTFVGLYLVLVVAVTAAKWVRNTLPFFS